MRDSRNEVVDLTRKLLAFDTINPPGQEAQAMAFCASWLGAVGFECVLHRHSDERASLVATRGVRDGTSLCLSGHLDTVPLGDLPWQWPPFDGHVEGDKLFGRGSSDMKGAVAAFMLACRDTPQVRGGVTILLTAGEETGCDGARWLVESGTVPKAGAMIVGESTGNRPFAGHKGAYWLKLIARGKTAHGATPERGVNAIMKAASLATRLNELTLGAHHPVMGDATWNVGTIRGGININSVPDYCELTLDMRSVEGADHREFHRKVKELAGPELDIEVLLDLPAVWSDPDCAWFAKATQTISRVTGVTSRPGSVNYFTDASILKPAMGDVPVMVLGPGSPDQPHSTNEHVLISRLSEAVEIYGALLQDYDPPRVG